MLCRSRRVIQVIVSPSEPTPTSWFHRNFTLLAISAAWQMADEFIFVRLSKFITTASGYFAWICIQALIYRKLIQPHNPNLLYKQCIAHLCKSQADQKCRYKCKTGPRRIFCFLVTHFGNKNYLVAFLVPKHLLQEGLDFANSCPIIYYWSIACFISSFWRQCCHHHHSPHCHLSFLGGPKFVS